MTILALAGGGKVERVDWSLVLANFADEPATTAHKAGPHVLGAKLQGGLQGRHELSPVQLRFPPTRLFTNLVTPLRSQTTTHTSPFLIPVVVVGV